jgi:hypothetical protein
MMMMGHACDRHQLRGTKDTGKWRGSKYATCAHTCVCVCVRVCVCARVRVRVCACAHTCVNVWTTQWNPPNAIWKKEEEGEWVIIMEGD